MAQRKITIQKNVPRPNPNQKRGISIYPWKEMQVGDSFFVPSPGNGKKNPISGGAVGAAARRLRIKLSTRAVRERGKKGIRVWRVG